MNGVEILSQTSIHTADDFIALGIFTAIVTLTFLCIGILMLICKEPIGIIPIIASIVFGCFTFYMFSEYINRTSYKEYKVTINESVKMSDFLNKYTIVSQEGKIYTVDEKVKSK